jgi:nicotinamidase-related amidase
MIPAHDVFHAHCRQLGIPVIMTQYTERYGGIDDVNSKKHNRRANWRVLYDLYYPPNPPMEQHGWEGTQSLDLMVETQPEDYYIRTKKRLSAFYPTDLEFLLRNLDAQNVVITGTYTDACDLSTAFDAANRDFRVIVPRDIVAGYSEEAEHAALLIISLYLGIVVDSPALLAEWYARKGRPLPEELKGITEISEISGEIEAVVAV